MFGLAFSLDSYVAKAKDLRQVEVRLDQKIVQDRIDFLQGQIWKLEDRYGTDCNMMKDTVRDTLYLIS